jgi:hypothetical protein
MACWLDCSFAMTLVEAIVFIVQSNLALPFLLLFSFTSSFGLFAFLKEKETRSFVNIIKGVSYVLILSETSGWFTLKNKN